MAALSPAQLAVLKAAADGGVYRMSTRRTLYRWTARGRSCAVNATVDALLRAGLVKVDFSGVRAVAVLTDAGRALLESTNGKEPTR